MIRDDVHNQSLPCSDAESAVHCCSHLPCLVLVLQLAANMSRIPLRSHPLEYLWMVDLCGWFGVESHHSLEDVWKPYEYQQMHHGLCLVDHWLRPNSYSTFLAASMKNKVQSDTSSMCRSVALAPLAHNACLRTLGMNITCSIKIVPCKYRYMYTYRLVLWLTSHVSSSIVYVGDMPMEPRWG